MKRCCVLIVLDSVGIGAMPDAHIFGDEGSNTLANISLCLGGLRLPHLYSLGLANIDESGINERVSAPLGAFSRAAGSLLPRILQAATGILWASA